MVTIAMTIAYTHVCDLLQACEDIRTATRREPVTVTGWKDHCTARLYITLREWFQRHREAITSSGTDKPALMSTLFPDRRRDRVYDMAARSLWKVIAGGLHITGTTREAEMAQAVDRGTLSMSKAVECLMQQVGSNSASGAPPCVEDIEELLEKIAAWSRRSSSTTQSKRGIEPCAQLELRIGEVLRKLSPRDGKWLVRLLLKDLHLVQLPFYPVLGMIHSSLPCAYKIRSRFDAAWSLVQQVDAQSVGIAPQPAKTRNIRHYAKVLPEIGVPVVRPLYLKAWSILDIFKVSAGRKMCFDTKMDGEFVEIHYDIAQGLKTFSKVGRESTDDCRACHGILRQALRIDRSDCAFKQNCIIQGELVVWSDEDGRWLPFHHMRKHMTRNRWRPGTEKDSPAKPHEHLGIAFFDLIKLDDWPVIHEPYYRRRKRLEKLIAEIPGRATLVETQLVDCSAKDALAKVAEILSKGIAEGIEGFVLKPAHAAYIDTSGKPARESGSCHMKIKVDYISGLGDSLELAAIGACKDIATAEKLGMPEIRWTHFFLAALENKAQVLHSGARKHYRVINITNSGLSGDRLKELCKQCLSRYHLVGDNSNDPYDYDIDVSDGEYKGMEVIFEEPLILEMKGFGFTIPQNCDRHALRHPVVIKDRSRELTWRDVMSYDEFQALAVTAEKVADVGLVEEVRRLTAKIVQMGSRTSSSSAVLMYETDDEDLDELGVVEVDTRREITERSIENVTFSRSERRAEISSSRKERHRSPTQREMSSLIRNGARGIIVGDVAFNASSDGKAAGYSKQHVCTEHQPLRELPQAVCTKSISRNKSLTDTDNDKTPTESCISCRLKRSTASVSTHTPLRVSSQRTLELGVSPPNTIGFLQTSRLDARISPISQYRTVQGASLKRKRRSSRVLEVLLPVTNPDIHDCLPQPSKSDALTFQGTSSWLPFIHGDRHADLGASQGLFHKRRTASSPTTVSRHLSRTLHKSASSASDLPNIHAGFSSSPPTFILRDHTSSSSCSLSFPTDVPASPERIPLATPSAPDFQEALVLPSLEVPARTLAKLRDKHAAVLTDISNFHTTYHKPPFSITKAPNHTCRAVYLLVDRHKHGAQESGNFIRDAAQAIARSMESFEGTPGQEVQIWDYRVLEWCDKRRRGSVPVDADTRIRADWERKARQTYVAALREVNGSKRLVWGDGTHASIWKRWSRRP
jgi:hypothetical protein